MNKTKQFLLIILNSRKYSYEDIFSKLDLFFLLDRISESEYLELSQKVKSDYQKEEVLEGEVYENVEE